MPFLHRSDYRVYKAAAKRPAAAITPAGRAKAVTAGAALPVACEAAAEAELAADETAPAALERAALALDAAELAAPLAEPVEDAVAEAEPEQPAWVGRFVTPTGEQICWAN